MTVTLRSSRDVRLVSWPASGGAETPRPALPVSTGRIETAAIGDLTLESGTTLPDVHIAYRHDGPAPGTAPQVLVVHALTGSADAAGDWWEPLIGPGKALDTTRVGVLCTNLLGGRYGSTGPVSVDPTTGRVYGPAFPWVTTRDQARAIWAVSDLLGIDRFSLVTGGSLGGMVALEVAVERPVGVGHLLPMAAPAALGAMAIAWNHIQATLIAKLGIDGMAIARQLAMTTYRSEADFDERFGRSQQDDHFQVVSYLEYQGRKLVDRFDPDTYRILAGAMDRHDIGRDRGGIEAALGRLAVAGVPVTALGIEDDILYGPRQVKQLVAAAEAAGVRTRYLEIRSSKGHDAFLVEWDQLATIVREALGEG
ncbi:MAG: homoserine O-acetyltransferase [Chloroflexota bacterium]